MKQKNIGKNATTKKDRKKYMNVPKKEWFGEKTVWKKKILIVIQTAVYIADRVVIQWNFSNLKNPRFQIESGL